MGVEQMLPQGSKSGLLLKYKEIATTERWSSLVRVDRWGRDSGIRLLILHFKFHQIFNISHFPQFNLSFEKKSLFPNMPKNHRKMYTKLPNMHDKIELFANVGDSESP